jgi:bacillithiol synthase
VLPVKAQCLPFSQIPHTTKLYNDFLAYSSGVQTFYPHSSHFGEWFEDEAAAIRYDPSRRERVSAILERQNSSWNASPQILANLSRLRKGAAAIVTGQQVGLFGGPMFAIYKALTAVKLAEEATAAGSDAVPVFWLATSDHDLAEVNHVSFPGSDGLLRTFTTPSHGIVGAPVGEVRLGDEILPVVEEAASLLGDSDATQLLRESYRPGETLGTAFARFYARLFGQWGVIVLDASDAELHRVAAPIYKTAIERAGELNAALLDRGAALEKAGYHQQVKVTESSALLFTIREGARTPMLRRSVGSGSEFAIGSEPGAEKLSSVELLERIAATPEKFSPKALFRPVVQDYLLPTLAYVGGAAEAAYFAQAGVVYEKLLGRITAIVPRFSATLVEPKTQRWLRQYDIAASDTFQDADAVRRALASRTLPEGVQTAFDAVQKKVAESLAQLRGALEKLDSTLVGASETADSKMTYQLDKLRQLATAAELRRSEVIVRHAEALSQALYPNGALQERGVAGVYYVARHGLELLQNLHEIIHTDCHDHQIVEL